MAFQRAGIDAGMQARLREIAKQVRLALSGPDSCPEWGTQFREIEQQGISVGLELARLVLEQSVATPSKRVPDAAGDQGRHDAVDGARDDAMRAFHNSVSALVA